MWHLLTCSDFPGLFEDEVKLIKYMHGSPKSMTGKVTSTHKKRLPQSFEVLKTKYF